MSSEQGKGVQLNVRVSTEQAQYLKVLAGRMANDATVADVVRLAIEAHELLSRLAILSDPLKQAWVREQTDGLLGLRDATARGLGRVWVSDLLDLWRRAFPEMETDRFLAFLNECV